jgi:CheY-like chemotaxis protein
MTRILLVDDDEDYCETLKEVFNQIGYSLTYLLSAENAVRFAKRYRPDLAILDFNIGAKMKGDELARRLRADPVTARIPLLLASSSDRARQKALDAGVNIFLRKPVELSNLIEVVASLTETPAPMSPVAFLDASHDPEDAVVNPAAVVTSRSLDLSGSPPRHCAEAEIAFPGISRFYLTCLPMPRTFLDLVWRSASATIDAVG